MKKLFAGLLIFAMLFSLAACNNTSGGTPTPGGNSGGTPTPGGNGGEEVEYEDTIIWVIGNDQDVLDPQINVSNNKVIPLIYSGLLKIDMEGNAVLDIATGYELADDNLTWTFTLREDVYFHNGKHVTAYDFENTFNRLLDTENPVRYTANYGYIEHAIAIDEYTFEIKTKEPKGSFLSSIAGRATAVMDIEVIESSGADLGYKPAGIVGTGPFKVLDWKIGEELSLEANENYYDGAPLTKYVIMQIVPEQNSRAIAIETGQAHIADGVSPDDAVRLGETAGLILSKSPSLGSHVFQFNCKSFNAPIADVKVRQAISYAIDRETICEALFSGLGEVPMTNIIPAGVFGYTDLGVHEYNPEKAKELLAEAGYPDGFNMKVMTTAVYNRGIEMGEMIAAQLEEVGIIVELDVVERAVFTESLNGLTPEQFKWDMFIMGIGGNTDYDQTIPRIAKTDAGGTNINNYGFYSNERVDELLTIAAMETDPDVRASYYAEVSQILVYDDPFAVYLNWRNNVYVIDERIENFLVSPGNTMDLVNIRLRKG